MKTLKSSLLLCVSLVMSPASAGEDAEMKAFEASSDALRSGEANAKARRAAVDGLSPRLQKLSQGQRAASHIAAAGACAIEVPSADLDKLSSLATAEAILDKPLSQAPLDGRKLALLTMDAVGTEVAVAAANKRQVRLGKLAQAERDWVSRIRVEVKKINPKGEPSDCRYLRAQIDDLLEKADSDDSLVKAEVILLAVAEIERRNRSAR
ncbi:hypothetical protein [Achromobacter sp. GD03932]|uniref:hypothetical protein n=1 Tax=Achromobacter sp. GD03932 TaxID=2975407 RepID=UPI00244BE7D1|nr:hypothetical protein [Achromobacter sp. GD03932]MDH1299872.1 hypothetical protein [Achromobacter sp. GD03932]